MKEVECGDSHKAISIEINNLKPEEKTKLEKCDNCNTSVIGQTYPPSPNVSADTFGRSYESAKHKFRNLKNQCNTKSKKLPFLLVLLA